ncbi:hypothetical protein ACTXT7_016314 [Hymenolepis weldensis]
MYKFLLGQKINTEEKNKTKGNSNKELIQFQEAAGNETNLKTLCIKFIVDHFESLIGSRQKGQKFVLNVSGIDLANLVDSFSKETKENLHTFNVENMKIGRRRRRIAFEALEQLHNLQVLKMIRTNLDSKYLRIIVRSLPRLTYLDISETTVDNICCLKELKDRLKVLIMHMPTYNRIRTLNRTLFTILELKELRILDVSTYVNGGLEPYANANQLIKPETLPHLRYFDISGNPFHLDIADVL